MIGSSWRARVTRVLELDLAQNTTTVFGGDTVNLKSVRWPAGTGGEQYAEFAEKKADLVVRARKQREWSSQGVRNAIRKSPDNDKIRRRRRGVQREAGAEGATDGEPHRPAGGGRRAPQGVAVQMSIGTAPRSSSVVATLADAVVQQGDFVLGPVSLQVEAGDRIGITGAQRGR